MHSSRRRDERARPEIVRNILGHVDIRMTQNVYGKSWWEERVDAVTQAVEPATNAVSKGLRFERPAFSPFSNLSRSSG